MSAIDDAIRARSAPPSIEQQPIEVALAVQAERDRIVALLAMQQPGFEREIADAIKTGASVSDTAVRILAIQADRGITLRAIAADSKGVPFAPAADPGGSKARHDTTDDVYKRRSAQTQTRTSP
jgi:hypothetical protein